MRVELNIDADCEEAFAIINISKLTPAVQSAIEILENEGAKNIITARANGKLYIIDQKNVEVIRTEGREVVLYNRLKERYVLNKPLYMIQDVLNNEFVQISKSAVVNFNHIHHVDATFNGTMEITMCNGIEEVITRSFKQRFRERLGV